MPSDSPNLSERLIRDLFRSIGAALRKARSGARIIVLTGYGNIATAVAAVKAGAVDYLPKPADADQIAAARKEASKRHTLALIALGGSDGL